LSRFPNLPEINQVSVDRYWAEVTPSILGPYMMDGFGFPTSAGDFRFRAESRIVRRLTRNLDPKGVALDLGSGIGYWAELFARDFAEVVAVEGSPALYQALKERCAPYSNVRPVLGNVLSFELNGKYDLVFLGGLLMYLDENDVIALLQRLAPFLGPGGIILCRESTVRNGTVTREGEYPVVYRSVSVYSDLFNRCGLILNHVERNEPYVLSQMACELIKKWKQSVPASFQALRIAGGLAYGGMRMGNPWIMRLPRALGISFPKLENHFFVLGTSAS
jgi:SAM-dependent methyltransferase